LSLAIGLSTAIGRLHQRGIIHKHIKPANVLVNSVTGRLFSGCATDLNRSRCCLAEEFTPSHFAPINKPQLT